MSDHKTYAYFYVKGFDCSPDEITSTLALEPTDSWLKGDLWGEGNIRVRKENCWRFKTKESEDDYGTNALFYDLLPILEDRREQLLSISKIAEIGITYVPTCYFPNVGVVLDKKLLSRLVSLGLSIDFDIYSLSDGD